MHPDEMMPTMRAQSPLPNSKRPEVGSSASGQCVMVQVCRGAESFADHVQRRASNPTTRRPQLTLTVKALVSLWLRPAQHQGTLEDNEALQKQVRAPRTNGVPSTHRVDLVRPTRSAALAPQWRQWRRCGRHRTHLRS